MAILSEVKLWCVWKPCHFAKMMHTITAIENSIQPYPAPRFKQIVEENHPSGWKFPVRQSHRRSRPRDRAGGQTGLCPALDMRPDRYPLARYLICVINVPTKQLTIGLRVLLLHGEKFQVHKVMRRLSSLYLSKDRIRFYSSDRARELNGASWLALLLIPTANHALTTWARSLNITLQTIGW